MNYNISVSVNTKAECAFEAISSRVNDWWGKVDNHKPLTGDAFSVFFDKTEWRFQVTESSPNKRIAWTCIKADHHDRDLEGIKEEWMDSKIIWQITQEESSVRIDMEHNGLTPNLNCYDICEKGWNYFVGSSLKAFLETGIGQPYQES